MTEQGGFLVGEALWPSWERRGVARLGTGAVEGGTYVSVCSKQPVNGSPGDLLSLHLRALFPVSEAT